LKIQNEAIETDRSFSHIINYRLKTSYEERRLINTKN